ncbi:MAG: NADAR family protein, partial [Actinomycetota bacterium]|nr:NADAR family protein [Actinomycetota bacterium]
EAWRAACTKGVCLVTDEVQSAKNASMQNDAQAVLVAEMRAGAGALEPCRGGSCLVALSATTMDHHAQAENILRALGLLPLGAPAFEYDDTDWLPRGAQTLIDTCRSLDADLTRRILCATLDNTSGTMLVDPKTRHLAVRGTPDAEQVPLASGDRPTSCLMHLFLQVVLPRVGVAASSRFDADPLVQLDYANVIYPVSDADSAKYRALVAELEAARRAKDPSEVSRIETELEHMKKELFSVRAHAVCQDNPRAKVIIALNRLGTIEWTAEDLRAQGYGVEVITGAVSAADRLAILERFQAPDARTRILIVQITAACQGISLHDVTGEWPRTTLISPSALATPIVQMMFRTKRIGVRGRIAIEIVYGGSGEAARRTDAQRRIPDEHTVMKLLTKKSHVIKSVQAQMVQDGVPFPVDLPVFTASIDGRKRERYVPERDDSKEMTPAARKRAALAAEARPVHGPRHDDGDEEEEEERVHSEASDDEMSDVASMPPLSPEEAKPARLPPWTMVRFTKAAGGTHIGIVASYATPKVLHVIQASGEAPRVLSSAIAHSMTHEESVARASRHATLPEWVGAITDWEWIKKYGRPGQGVPRLAVAAAAAAAAPTQEDGVTAHTIHLGTRTRNRFSFLAPDAPFLELRIAKVVGGRRIEFRFASVTHYLLAREFSGDGGTVASRNALNSIARTPDLFAARQIARNERQHATRTWSDHTERFEAMLLATRAKLECHPDLQRLLLSTGEKRLYVVSDEPPYAYVPMQQPSNIGGRVLERLRADLRQNGRL